MTTEEKLQGLLSPYAPPMLLALSGEPDRAAVYRFENRYDVQESGQVLFEVDIYQIMLYMKAYTPDLMNDLCADALRAGHCIKRGNQSFDNGYYIDTVRIQIIDNE